MKHKSMSVSKSSHNSDTNSEFKIFPSLSHDFYSSCSNCIFHVIHHKKIFCGLMWHDLLVQANFTCQYQNPIRSQTRLFYEN